MPQTLPIPFCGGKKTTPFKLAFPIYGGGIPHPSNLPPTARRGEGDHEVVEGAAEGGIIKTCGEAATTTL